MQLYPALRGEKEFSALIPVLFTPAVPAAASADEMDILRQMSFENGTHQEELSSSISSHHIEADVDSLIRLRVSSLQHASKVYWITCGLTAIGLVLSLFITYYFTQIKLGTCLKFVLLIVTAQQLVVIRSLNLKVCYLRNQVLLVLNVKIGLSQIQK